MNLLVIVAAIAPTFLLLWFFHSRDVHPEPPKVMWITFILGLLATLPVILFGGLFYRIALFLGMENLLLTGFFIAFIVAAIPEEVLKYLAFTRYALRHRAFDEPMDGVVYGVCVSLGFATLENILYVVDGGLVVALLRAVTAVPQHAMTGVIMGYYAGRAKFTGNSGTLFARALCWPILLHGAYDTPLMILKNDENSLSTFAVLLLLLFFLAVMVFEIVWCTKIIKELRAQQLAGLRPGQQVQTGGISYGKLLVGGTLLTVASLWMIAIVQKKLFDAARAEWWELGAQLGLAVFLVIIGFALFIGGLNRKNASNQS